MSLDKYLIFDGKHKSALEAEEMEKKGRELPSFIDKNGIQKIYRFPNGYGASIIKGWFSHNLWEIIIIVFKDDSDDYAITSDINRYSTYEEIEQVLPLIKCADSEAFSNIDEFPF